MRRHDIVQEEESGYVLNPRRSYFAVVVPEDTINLVVNPECVDLFGYDTINSSAASVSTHQRRGAKSLLVTPSSPGGGVIYRFPSVLPDSRHHTFSVDINGSGMFSIFFGDSDGALIGSENRFLAPPFWDRRSITWMGTQTNVQSVCVVSLDGVSFYADGFQCEAKSYATTFVSGNIEAPEDVMRSGRLSYGWMGGTHRSMSYRTKHVTTGGRPVPLSDLGFEVTEFSGFGYLAPELVTSSLAMRPDRVYQGMTLPERQFTIGGVVRADNLRDVASRRGMVGAGIYGASSSPSPIIMHVQLYDDTNPISELAEIECMYVGGMEGQINNLYQERVTATFRTWRPLLRVDGNSAADLDIDTTTTNSPINVVYEDGTVDALPDGDLGWSDDDLPYRMAIGVDGLLYIVMSDRLLKYTRSSIVEIDNVPGCRMKDVVSAPDGRIYYMYEDDADGSDTAHVKRYSPLSGQIDWDDAGTEVEFHSSLAPSLEMSRLRVDQDRNRLYVCGGFSGIEVGGAPVAGDFGNFDGICYYDIATGEWHDFPEISDDDSVEPIIYDVAFAWSAEWVVGKFKSIGDTPGLNKPWGYSRYNSDVQLWEYGERPFTRGDVSSQDDMGARVILYDKTKNLLFVGGDFDRFIYWDELGVQWNFMTGNGIAVIEPLSGFPSRAGYGVKFTDIPGIEREDIPYAFVTDLALAPDGKLLVVGGFDTAYNTDGVEHVLVPSQLRDVPASGVAIYDSYTNSWAAGPIQSPPLYEEGYTLPAYSSSVVVAPGVPLIGAYGGVILPDFTEWSGDLSSDAIVSNRNAIYISHTDTGETTYTPATTINVQAGCRALARIEITGPATVNRIVNATTGAVFRPNLYVNAGETLVMSLAPGPVWVRSTTRGEVAYPNLGKDSFPDLNLISGSNNIVMDVVADVGSEAHIYWRAEYASLDALVAANA